MKITKLLSLESRPAQTLLARAKKVELAYADRVAVPAQLTVDGTVYENALGDTTRPLEVGDVLVDEKGGFILVEAAGDKVLHVTGDVELMQEAIYAFLARGIRVAKTEDGFGVIANDNFARMLESVGLQCVVVNEPFVPVPLARPHEGGCGCGCCGCSGEDEEGESCGCGCGGHHHHHDGECECGHDHEHHHDDGECGCGHEHHHDGECGCGGHHHHHGENEACECGCHDHGHHHEEHGERKH